MDLNKSAGSPKSPDAKTEGGLASSPPANIKAENPSAADAEAPVAPPRKAAGSPKKDSAVVPEGIRRRESYCLFIRVQKDVDAVSKRDQRIDPEAWNELICRNICENRLNAPEGTFTVQLLSETEFLLYEGKKDGPGMTWDNARGYIQRLQGMFPWCGVRAFLVAGQRTLKRARIDVADSFWFRRERNQEKTALDKFRKQNRKKGMSRMDNIQPDPETPKSRGRGMIRRSDKSQAKKLLKQGALPVMAARPASPDDYHSARDASDFEYESDDPPELDPEHVDTDYDEEEDGAFSGYSSAGSVAVGYETDRTERSNTANRDKKRQKQKQRENRTARATNARKEQDKRSGKVVLPLFRESGKEGALKYDDWRAEVDEYLRKGYPSEQVKSAMFSSLEGQPRKNFQDCDEDGNLTPAEILVKMDGVYNASVAFRDLSARLCALKQGTHENIKTYYERMVDIAGKLREHHAERFRPGELKSMKKECFFAGLRDNNKYLVAHMRDRDHTGPAEMLKEIREHEENRYPANTSYRPPNNDHFGKDKKSYSARPANLAPEPEPEKDPDDDEYPDEFSEESYDQGYCVAVLNIADEADHRLGVCFNCGKPGHQWRDCPEELKESLKAAKERLNREKRQLNKNGGVGVKAGRAPQTAGHTKAPMAKPRK